MHVSIALLFVLFVSYTFAADICSAPLTGPGGNYDLSALKDTVKATGLPDAGRTYDYEINLCSASIACNGKTASFCQEWDGGSSSIGTVSSASVTAEKTITVVVTGGDNIGATPRSAEVVLTCDETVPTLTLKSVTYTGAGAAYKATGVSAHACPAGGAGVVILIILIILILGGVGGAVYWFVIKPRQESRI
eukprot:TRINITY_DN365_c0_g1_i1.p1 TRINITY_DN365_c0_g1~~TRINITY_DN365_c0_g1_i1.p1  ORF type:complete len:192 (-),score=53.65 TRINITY_DN365_c0_g1_i1:102-677(-)